jgi:CAAX protease family protein
MTSPNPRKKALLALVLLVPVPSLGTWMGMVAMPGPVGSAVFMLSKAWILVLPLVWLLWVDKERPHIPRPTRRGMLAACVSGSIIFNIIAAAYFVIGRNWIDPGFVRDKAFEVGLKTPAIYILGAIYWCTVNSSLEEYTWRWFVFTRCETLMPRWPAVIASGLFFTLHHIVALNVYFDWRVTVLATLGVFVGGATWSWLYLRYRNIWAAYVSHVFADVVIFVIGYHLIFGFG